MGKSRANDFKRLIPKNLRKASIDGEKTSGSSGDFRTELDAGHAQAARFKKNEVARNAVASDTPVMHRAAMRTSTQAANRVEDKMRADQQARTDDAGAHDHPHASSSKAHRAKQKAAKKKK